MPEQSLSDDFTDSYTYRFIWSERQLEFFITCDELPSRRPESSPYAEQLLQQAKQGIRHQLTCLHEPTAPVPLPLHANAAEITRRSMLRATRDAAAARSSDPDPWLQLTAGERSLLGEILLWTPVGTCGLTKHQLFQRTTDAYHSAVNILIIMAANRRDDDDADEAGRLDRIRYGYEHRFTHLNPNNRRKTITFMADCLHECAAQLRNMTTDYYPAPDHDLTTWPQSHDGVPNAAIMRAALHRGISRYDEHRLEQRYWPWLPENDILQSGWRIRFGVDMYEDTRSVLDSLDHPFRIVRYRRVNGLLHIEFKSAEKEQQPTPVRIPEPLRLLAQLYETLAAHTCCSCGTQHDVRQVAPCPHPLWGPCCRRCAHTSRYWRHKWNRLRPIPQDALDDSQIRHASKRLHELGFAELHIYRLIRTCINETAQTERQ